eukprot:6820039-Alexandrium_andersonii.AAC.1
MAFPNLGPCHIGAPLVLADSQLVCLWESFFNVVRARNLSPPGQPAIMPRPYRGIPYSAQPGPRDMRRGETFDACVPLLY